jgi:hypothetical protein
MKKILQFFIAIFFTQNIFAQPQINPKSNFYMYGFSTAAILNANNTLTYSSWTRTQFEGCAQLNDPNTGNLIFTTDGANVYNPSGITIPNGTGLRGTNSSTNAATIIPMNIDYGYLVNTSDIVPATNSTFLNNFAYYSMYQLGNVGGLYNPSINSNKKNIQLLAPGIDQFGEKTVVVRRNGDLGFYLIMHSAEGPNNKIVVFKNVGTDIVHSGTFSAGTTVNTDNGQMRSTDVDANGNCKIIAAYSMAKKIDVYNFNYNTGILSLLTTYNLSSYSATPYGLEISPDGKIVYFSDYTTFGRMFSIDLSTSIIHFFQNLSTTQVSGQSTYGRFGQIQNLDNGQMYFTAYSRLFIFRISNPNTFGLLSTYGFSSTNSMLTNSGLRFGLPNYNRL